MRSSFQVGSVIWKSPAAELVLARAFGLLLLSFEAMWRIMFASTPAEAAARSSSLSHGFPLTGSGARVLLGTIGGGMKSVTLFFGVAPGTAGLPAGTVEVGAGGG